MKNIYVNNLKCTLNELKTKSSKVVYYELKFVTVDEDGNETIHENINGAYMTSHAVEYDTKEKLQQKELTKS